jgi:hypothetical protein
VRIRNRDPEWLVVLYPWMIVAFIAVSLKVLLTA